MKATISPQTISQSFTVGAGEFNTENNCFAFDNDSLKILELSSTPLAFNDFTSIIDPIHYNDFIASFNSFLSSRSKKCQTSFSIQNGLRLIGFTAILKDEHNKKATSYSIILQDLTAFQNPQLERKHTENELFLNIIYEYTSIGLFVVEVTELDGEYHYRYSSINSTHEKMLGIPTEDVLGKEPDQLSDHFAPEVIEYIKGYYKACIESKEVMVSESIAMIDNQETWWLTTLTPVFDKNGTIYRLIGAALNITERKKIEHELKVAKEKAEESDHLKSAFLANLSHEIRTPMNAIIGFSELLKEGELSKKQYNYTEIITNSGQQLLSIINDILDISKIEVKQLRIDPIIFSINAVIDKMHTCFYHSKPQDVKFLLRKELPDQLSYIRNDDTRFEQVLTNLLSNAFKFTKSGTVEWGYKLESQDTLCFYVEDTGCGIKPEDQELIFEPFRQAEQNVLRKSKGTGLGLAISKALVDLMGGEIKIESTPEKGSTFSFTLPYKQLHSPMKKAPPADKIEFDWRDKTILIVEDDDFSVIYLEQLLMPTKVQLIKTACATDAIECLKENTEISAVLMDIQLPDMNGYEATGIIKNINTTIPVIAQTANVMKNEKTKALESGCVAYLSKPINKNELLKVLDQFMV